MEPDKLEKLLADMKAIVGDEHINSDIEERYNYGRDMTEQVAPSLPDVVVQPDSVSEVQEIVKYCNENLIPITPFVTGANVGGLTLPHKGGVTLDFKRMRRVVELNKECKYIVVEPGFTFGHLRRLFDTEIPEFRYSFPFSPPWTSVGINALLHGLGSLSVLYGSAENFINGLEVVLPTGELVQVGNHAVNNGRYWYGRAPLPDLAGLFIGMQGTTGVATKISIQLMDRPPIQEHFALIPGDAFGFFRDWVSELVNLHVCDEIGCGYFPPKVAHGIVPDDMIELMAKLMKLISKGKNAKRFNRVLWPLLKVLSLGNPFSMVKKFAPLLRMKTPGEDEAFLICGLTIGAPNREVFKAKVKTLKKFVKKKNAMLIQPDDFGDLKPVFMSILDLPAQLPAFYDVQRGGGLTWVGSYVPPPVVAEGLERGEKILNKWGFFPVGVLRPMKHNHYFVLRFIIPYNQGDQDTLDRVKMATREVADLILDIGGVPYKMAPWAAKKIWSRAEGSGFFELLQRVKKLLDPNEIMNPGKLVVDMSEDIDAKLGLTNKGIQPVLKDTNGEVA
ncbi:MAG: FAD-binding oxidoreductase [Promethearchaeota archaeon]